MRGFRKEFSLLFSAKVLDWVKLPPKYMFAICIVTMALLFAPDAWAIRLGIAPLVTTYRAWIGIAFIASSGLLVATVVFDFIPKSVHKFSAKRRRAQRAHALTYTERCVIATYIQQNLRVYRWNMDSGTIKTLEGYGFLYRASNVGHLLTGFPYGIHEWAWNYFHQNPELLGDAAPLGEGTELF